MRLAGQIATSAGGALSAREGRRGAVTGHGAAHVRPPCGPSPQLAHAAHAARCGDRACMTVYRGAETCCCAGVASAAGRASHSAAAAPVAAWALDIPRISASASSRTQPGSSAAGTWPGAAAMHGGVEQCQGGASGFSPARHMPACSSASRPPSGTMAACTFAPGTPSCSGTGRAKPTAGCAACAPPSLRGPIRANGGGGFCLVGSWPTESACV